MYMYIHLVQVNSNSGTELPRLGFEQGLINLLGEETYRVNHESDHAPRDNGEQEFKFDKGGFELPDTYL